MRKLLRRKERLDFDALPIEIDEHTRYRFFTLAPTTLKITATKRGDHNKLGFALHWCWLSLLGWQPNHFDRTTSETIAFVAQQIQVDPAALARYPQDVVTWWDHAAEVRRALGWRKYSLPERKGLIAEVQRVALQHDDSKGLLQAAVEWCRRERVVRPGLTTLEEDVSTATARAERQLHHWVHNAPPPETRQAFWARIDRLVEPASQGRTERLPYFKAPPGQPTATNLLAICERITHLSALGIASLDLSKLNPNRRKWLANEAMRKSPADLSALKPFKRHGALGCLLVDILQSSYDYAAEMYLRLMTESRSRAEAKRQVSFAQQREKFLGYTRSLGHCCEIVADASLTPPQKIKALHRELGSDEQLLALAAECAELTHPDRDSRIAFMRNKISYVNRFAPTFIQTMNFAAVEADVEAQAVMAGVKQLRAVYADAKEFSDQPPLTFLTPKLKSEIVKADGQVERALWEIALNECLAEALRAGTIYLPNSQSYRPLEWEIRVTKIDRKVTLRHRPLLSSFEVYRKQRTEEYDAVCGAANTTILDQPEVEIREGHVHIGRPVAQPELEDMAEFRAQLKEAMEKRKLPDILGITLNWVDYLQPFRSLVSHDVRLPHLEEVLQAILMSEACNIGPDTMANSTPGITNVHLARVGDRCLNYDAIEAAWAMVVDAYNRLEMAGLYGRGDWSSSDGMLVPIPVKAFMARLHPQAPKGKRVVNFMSWVVDKMMGFSGLVMQTTSHEAMYEFDGLFHNITQLRPTKHTADTAGFSALLFGTASLFDLYYAPRIRDFHTLHFYYAD